MISPEDIQQQVARWYPDFLRAELSGDNFFPKAVRFARVKPRQVTADFEKIHRQLVELRLKSKEERGKGYSVEWEEVNTRTIGKNRFPVSISVAGKSDYLALLPSELRTHYQQFEQASARLRRELPQLQDWMYDNVRKIGDYGPAWPDLLEVCRWFLHHYERGRYYIRELPVRVSTKFVERHKSILSELLLQLLPADRINAAYAGNRDHNFEKRFGLKYDETLIRVRYLDPSLTDGIDDLAIRHATFARHPFGGEAVIITENKMNFLTLPPVPRTLALWGGGFQVHLLREAQWLHSRTIYYWGDLDTHGLLILSQLRSLFAHVESLMMDRETLDRFHTGDQAPPIAQVNTAGLHEEELALFHHLKDGNIRLEQEKIPQWYVEEQLRGRVTL